MGRRPVGRRSDARIGPEPTLVESLNEGFKVDTKGVSSPIEFTRDYHRGLVAPRPYSHDYQTKKFKACGAYSDYQKFVK